MTAHVDVALRDRAYRAVVAERLEDVPLFDALQSDGTRGRGRPALLIDARVRDLHGETVRRWLAGHDPVVERVVPEGEGAKSFGEVGGVLEDLAASGLERRDFVVAVGGGVTGDVAGFAASIYRRGIGVLHVPTTLLAMIDSSLGGKTGVNLPAGKNLAGSFHQPLGIVAAVELLDTLSPRQFRSGLAEAIKYGMLFDPELFAWLEERSPRDPADLPREERVWLVRRCLEHKARIVVADERESGERRLLNLGHTLGHALEAACGYGDELYHGEAVGLGMLAACRLAIARELCAPVVEARLRALLEAVALPIAPPDDLQADAVLDALLHDKKRERGQSVWILPREVGRCEVVSGVERAEVERASGLPRNPSARP